MLSERQEFAAFLFVKKFFEEELKLQSQAPILWLWGGSTSISLTLQRKYHDCC
jgi:hypothetical protein